MRQLDNLHGTVQVQENIVAGIGGRIAGVDDGICQVRPGKAVCAVELVLCPPSARPIKANVEHKHEYHTDTQNKHPMNFLFRLRKRLVMYYDTSITLLDNLVATGIDVTPGA